MKKRVVWAITLLVVLTLFVGCGAKEAPTVEATAAPASTVTTPLAATAPTVSPKTATSTLQQI